MPEPRILTTGLGIPEAPRWHEGRLWFSNWGLQEILAVDLEGRTEIVVRVPMDLPFCIDWLPDGRLLVVSGPEGRLLRREPDGTLVTHADLGDGFPDGICLDAEAAAWYADIPNKRCVRVRDGGEVVQAIPIDRACFACTLGGADRKTLFVMAAEWRLCPPFPNRV